MIPWLLVGAGLLVAVSAVVAHWLAVRQYRRDRRTPDDPVPEFCVYLDEENVMNLYLQGDYPALRQEIENRIMTVTGQSLEARLAGLTGNARREAEKEIVSRYIKDVGPITVVGLIVREIARKDGLVHVDLFDGSFEPGKGLDRALRSAHGDDSTRRSARLTDLRPFVFVSVMGEFEETDKTGETRTLSVRYGGSDDSPWLVSVTCANSQFVGKVPSFPLPARCLGRIQKWQPGTRQLVIDRVLAIYG